ncbi:MAG: hypothetical protein LH613_06845 [Chamaesiphon sp.]|nr:hypothetical protein [Chamaesiphon sp.]
MIAVALVGAVSFGLLPIVFRQLEEFVNRLPAWLAAAQQQVTNLPFGAGLIHPLIGVDCQYENLHISFAQRRLAESNNWGFRSNTSANESQNRSLEGLTKPLDRGMNQPCPLVAPSPLLSLVPCWLSKTFGYDDTGRFSFRKRGSRRRCQRVGVGVRVGEACRRHSVSKRSLP